MKAKLFTEFWYMNQKVTVVDWNEVGDAIVQSDHGGAPFRISKRTLDGLPESDKGEGRSGVAACIKTLNDRQRVLLEALQYSEQLAQYIMDDARFILDNPAHDRVQICGSVIENNAKKILYTIACTKTPHDDDEVKS